MTPFSRNTARPGDLLALARFPTILLRFKGMGHDAHLVATWVKPQPGRALDVILRQGDVLVKEQA